MNKFRSETIWTVVLNFFILIGAGHGLTSIGLIEVWGILNKFEFNAEYFSFSLTASYEDSFGPVAILFLAGQISILLSLFLKKNVAIIWTRMFGLGFLWVGFYYLTHNFFNSTDGDLSQLSFYTGIPFLIFSFRLVYKTVRVDAPFIRANTGKHQAGQGFFKKQVFFAQLGYFI
jgi:dipeptide/tripeptide permease